MITNLFGHYNLSLLCSNLSIGCQTPFLCEASVNIMPITASQCDRGLLLRVIFLSLRSEEQAEKLTVYDLYLYTQEKS